MTPVYVPSKGRVGRSATLSALLNESHPEVCVVVPQGEAGAYRGEYPFTVISQVGGPGIGNARQTALMNARAAGHESIWLIDDDTRASYRRRNGTGFERTGLSEAMAEMETLVYGMVAAGSAVPAMYGPQFRHRAWQGPDAEWDVHLRNFINISTEGNLNYWPHVKEDLDMVLQIITRGGHTLRFNAYAFDSPTMGTLEGGCSDDYAAGALDEATLHLKEKWPEIVSMRLNEKEGRVENRVDWQRARHLGKLQRDFTTS